MGAVRILCMAVACSSGLLGLTWLAGSVFAIVHGMSIRAPSEWMAVVFYPFGLLALSAVAFILRFRVLNRRGALARTEEAQNLYPLVGCMIGGSVGTVLSAWLVLGREIPTLLSTAIALPVLLAGAIGGTFLAQRLGIEPTQCNECGYDLRGSPGPKCSECGAEMPAIEKDPAGPAS